MLRKTWFFTLGLTLLLAPGALAHYLWVHPLEGGYMVARGLLPDKFYAYDAKNVKDIKAFDVQGNPVKVQLRPEAERLAFHTAAPPALVAVLAEWGHRVNTPAGKELLSRSEALAKGLTVEEAFFSTQTAKTLLAGGAANTKAVGLPLEIVPQQDPLTLSPGQELPVQVLWRGQPLADTRVRVEGVQEMFRTDAAGQVRLRLAGQETQMIMASHRVSTPERQDIDYILYTTFLHWHRPE